MTLHFLVVFIKHNPKVHQYRHKTFITNLINDFYKDNILKKLK